MDQGKHGDTRAAGHRISRLVRTFSTHSRTSQRTPFGGRICTICRKGQDGPVKFTEIASRLNGISTPIFGVSWTPPTADVSVVRRVISFIEDRRVLYAYYPEEVPDQCIDSVVQIRLFLTEVIGEGSVRQQIEGPLRNMRAWCRRFLERVGQSEDPGYPLTSSRHLFRDPHHRVPDFLFGEALGEFRAGIVFNLAVLASATGLDIEEPLARYLPPPVG